MTIFNWLGKTWGSDNQSESYSQEPKLEQSYSQESEPEQRAPGIFDWLFGGSERNSEVTHYQESKSQYQYSAASEDLNIQGDPDFVAKISRAYNCLDLEDRAFIRENTNRIEQHHRVSGTFPIHKVILVGSDVLQQSEKSIAAMLSHEAGHNPFTEISPYSNLASSPNHSLTC